MEGAPSREVVLVVMVILGVLSVTGAAGNALVLYVFARKRDRLVSTLFIIVLAYVDFVTCVVIMPMTMYMEYFDFHVTSDFLCRSYQFLITSNIPFSALIMVAIAVDRYLSICHPFLRALNPARAKAIIGVLVAFAVALGLCVSLMFSVYGVDEMADVTTATIVAKDESGSRPSELFSRSWSVGQNERASSRVKSRRETRHQWIPETTEHQWSVTTSTENQPRPLAIVVVVNNGHCATSDLIIGTEFQYYYQKFYTTMFPVCLLVVVALYALIYRSVLGRRARRQSQKSQALPLIVSLRGGSQSAPQTTVGVRGAPDEASLITDESRVTNSGDEDPAHGGSRSSSRSRGGLNFRKRLAARGRGRGRGSSRRKQTSASDGNRLANLKTAAMLFVVTVTFVVTFLPAFLMAMSIVPHNMVVFYLYFANNVANPVIYSFMNKNFRQDLKKIFTNCKSRAF